MVVNKESKRLNNRPHQKLSILNPFTNRLASKTTMAFTTNKNNPSVIIVTGKVNRMISGFMKISRIARTMANTKAVQKVST
jgi:hypothetical protein